MGNLTLNSLEIKNFRAFRHLRIEKLGRVNLITGKNNVGKTTLLEALYLYAGDGAPYQLLELLDARDELRERRGSNETSNVSSSLEPHLPEINELFYGRKKLSETHDAITVGNLNNNTGWGMAIRWLPWQGTSMPILWQDWLALQTDIQKMRHPITPHLATKNRDQISFYSYPLQSLLNVRTLAIPSSDIIPCAFVRTSGGYSFNLSNTWDKIALTPEEDYILEAFQTIFPDIKRIGMIGEELGAQKRIPVVRWSDFDRPLPMRSLGEGMNRLFELLLALISAENGFLLIDEIEHGLHYSVQTEIWKRIFQIARRLNVQVFATTHSWDCVEAFQQAAKEDKNEEGLLLRLNGQEDRMVTLFDERKLGIATREVIEVR